MLGASDGRPVGPAGASAVLSTISLVPLEESSSMSEVPHAPPPPAPASASTASSQPSSPQRAAARLPPSAARLKADFEHALVSCLLFNTLYLYYCDARLLVLFIRTSQILRLLYFPYETPVAQRSTAFLLFMSNIPVLLIHAAIVVDGKVGSMLLINFIGPEPFPLAKMFYVDVVTMALQATLASVSAADGFIVSVLPAAPIVERSVEGSAQREGEDEAEGAAGAAAEGSDGDVIEVDLPGATVTPLLERRYP